MKFFPECISQKDLQSNMANVSFIGCIVKIQGHIPFAEDLRAMRGGLRIRDTHNLYIDITIWDTLFLECVKFREGQHVYVENAVITEKLGIIGLTCSSIANSKITNISEIFGILSSPVLFEPTMLRTAVAENSSFLTKAFIAQYKLTTSSVHLVHILYANSVLTINPSVVSVV
eukprot:TRINITY_DN6601_c0_g1_i10.p1 TRINITY_DN6601_c0_g1~~TRINITY_DN6601_c0_g1_i10.p1  ORF type:complete len:173 (-),score=17.40 TRINITY_DN6601_c0_g1_i10:10-528(-)